MTIALRPAHPSDCPALSALCLRSKGYWGYDAAFLDACREELTIRPDDIANHLIVAEHDGEIAGVAQVGWVDQDADIYLLFIDPPFIGKGLGRVLFDWCVDEARRMGAERLLIDADPGAEPFYARMGAKRIGERPSASIPGRVLPHLAVAL